MFSAKVVSKVASYNKIAVSHSRNFATKPDLPGVSGRYANTLYEAAGKKNSTAKVEEEVKNFKTLLASNPQLKVYLDSPVIPKAERTQSLDTILSKIGASDVFKSLFRVLVENRRTEFTAAILEDYLKLMKYERREVEGTITTAEPLTPEELEKVKSDIIAAKFEKGDKLNLVNKVDPSILGGQIVQIGNLYQDSSLRTEVNKIRKGLDEAFRNSAEQHRAFLLSGFTKEN